MAIRTVTASWYRADGTYGTTAGAQYGSCGPPYKLGMTFAEMQMGTALGHLKCGTQIRVTYQGKSVIVSKADIGGYVPGRAIDLFEPAAQQLGMTGAGVVQVQVEILGSGRNRSSVGQALSGLGMSRPSAATADTGAAVDKLLASYDQAINAPRSGGGTTQFAKAGRVTPGFLAPGGGGPGTKGHPLTPKQLRPTTGGFDFLPSDPFTAVADAIQSVLDFLKWIAWILHPVNLLRGVEFLTGAALMAFGIQATMQAYKEGRRGGYRGRRSAVKRSAAGRTAQKVVRATPAGRAERVVRGSRAGKRSARREQGYREYDRSYRASRRKEERRQSEKQAKRDQRKKRA